MTSTRPRTSSASSRLRARTEAIARHLTDFLKKTDRFAKTIVFCVDQEHAAEMRRGAGQPQRRPGAAASRLRVPRHRRRRRHRARPPVAASRTSRRKTPVILTTSQLLTTGVDAPTCKNVVLARVVGSMSEFKQIIGRGTRVRDDYGKLWFNILDYTGSATRLFADPDFDGDPARITEEEVNDDGETTATTETIPEGQEEPDTPEDRRARRSIEPPTGEPRKFYFDGGQVEIVAHLVYELDPERQAASRRQIHRLRRREASARSAPTSAELREPLGRCGPARARSSTRLAERGIDFDELAEADGPARRRPLRPALPSRLQCAACAPGASERSVSKSERKDFFEQFSPGGAHRSSTSFWKNTPNMVTRSLSCRMCCKFRPSQPTASPPKSSSSSAARMSFAQAVNDLQGLLYGTN